MKGHVKIERTGGIAHIEFMHPAHNSLPGEILHRLQQAIKHEEDQQDTRVILLRSAGDRTFCAGASFEELLAIRDEKQGKEFFMGFARVINAIRRSSKIVLGRVQGKAVGGGVGLACAVDYCYGTQWSSVKLSELALGIGPFVVGPAVRRKVGTSAFAQMSLQARKWYPAQWALDHGIYAEIAESADQMDEKMMAFAKELSDYSPHALRELKKVLWRGCEDWDSLLESRAQISGSLILTPEAQQAVDRIKNKK